MSMLELKLGNALSAPTTALTMMAVMVIFGPFWPIDLHVALPRFLEFGDVGQFVLRDVRHRLPGDGQIGGAHAGQLVHRLAFDRSEPVERRQRHAGHRTADVERAVRCQRADERLHVVGRDPAARPRSRKRDADRLPTREPVAVWRVRPAREPLRVRYRRRAVREPTMVGVGAGRAGASVVFGRGAVSPIWQRGPATIRLGARPPAVPAARPRSSSAARGGFGRRFLRSLLFSACFFRRSRGGGSFRLTAGGARLRRSSTGARRFLPSGPA